MFSARRMADLELYFSARGGRSLTPDALFDAAEEMFSELPQDERVFEPDTPVVVSVIMFDCRPTGNIRLEGTTRLIDETVPGDPFVMYERPFSIVRRQGTDGFTVSTSSGRGCMDNLSAGAPARGWEPGPYRVEYRDESGSLLVAIPFEVAGVTSSRASTSDGPPDSQPELWIDVNLEPWRPGAQIEVNSNFDIEPDDLLVEIHTDNRWILWGVNLYNRNRIGGAGFVPMDFDPIQLLPDIRWHETRLTGVSAATTESDFACEHDVATSDQRRQHPFDDRDVYFCSRVGASSADAVQPAGGQTTAKDRFMESFMDWCVTGENPAFCDCLGERVFWSISTSPWLGEWPVSSTRPGGCERAGVAFAVSLSELPIGLKAFSVRSRCTGMFEYRRASK